MRHLAEVIFYQLYRWFKFIIREADAEGSACYFFGIFLGVFLFNIINLTIYIGNDFILPIYIYIVTILVGIRISYLLFLKKKRYIKIVKKKPLFKNSVPLSIFITIMYAILTGFSTSFSVFTYKHFFK